MHFVEMEINAAANGLDPAFYYEGPSVLNDLDLIRLVRQLTIKLGKALSTSIKKPVLS